MKWLIEKSGSKVGLSAALFAMGLGISQPAFALLRLDPLHSQVNFISVKNESVTEVHNFRTISGMVNEQGTAVVDIDLASIDTNIEVRDERIKELLFDVVNYPEASINAKLNINDVNNMAVGESKVIPLTAELSLHDHQVPIETKVSVTALEDGGRLVSTLEPIVISAADFGLEGGIKALQDVAQLQSISTTIPVTVQLLFLPE
ncbi:YceI family protein [Vibrio gangliei]|uniref:YceI family protein n=1 Tax=Vibrio gangliei TaxID=2077090 RepID=UPI000D011FD0|nr:YceI family protein [Vibrio gangliei]